MKRSLTDTKVKNLKPKEKTYKTADGGGLYVHTTTKGSKSFRYDYKANNKYATLTFGQYPAITLPLPWPMPECSMRKLEALYWTE